MCRFAPPACATPLSQTFLLASGANVNNCGCQARWHACVFARSPTHFSALHSALVAIVFLARTSLRCTARADAIASQVFAVARTSSSSQGWWPSFPHGCSQSQAAGWVDTVWERGGCQGADPRGRIHDGSADRGARRVVSRAGSRSMASPPVTTSPLRATRGGWVVWRIACGRLPAAHWRLANMWCGSQNCVAT